MQQLTQHPMNKLNSQSVYFDYNYCNRDKVLETKWKLSPIPTLKDIPSTLRKSMTYNAEKKELKHQNNLWHATCFEVFLFSLKDPSYIELHNTPEGYWNHLTFDKYRTPHANQEKKILKPITIKTCFYLDSMYFFSKWKYLKHRHDEFQLKPALILHHLNQPSYWSLYHPNGKPDFHHRES